MRISLIALALTDSVSPGFNEHEDPLGICYVAAAALKVGHPVRIVQQTSESDQEVLDKALLTAPQVLGFTAVTAIWGRAATLAAKAKERQPGIITVIGGSHACAAPEECAQYFDFAVIGEGEHTFVDLLSALQHGRTPDNSGLCCQNKTGFVNTGYPKRIRDLDGLMPYREGLDHGKYDPAGSPPVPTGTTGFAAMITSRGCSHNCGFCSNASIWRDGQCGQPLATFRSPEDVLEEVKYLRNQLAVNYIAIEDTDFLARPRNQQYRLLDMLSKDASDVKWSCLARPDRILPPRHCTPSDRTKAEVYAHRLASAGCHLVCLGVESGDDNLRTSMGRRFSDESMLDVFAILTNAGIATTAFFVLGLPNETNESLRRTYELAMRLSALRLRLSFFYPFGNIPCASSEKREWISPEYEDPKFATTEMPTVKCGVSCHDMIQFRESLLHDFYARTQYVELVQGFSSRSSFWHETMSPWITHLRQQGYWPALRNPKILSQNPIRDRPQSDAHKSREATWNLFSLASTV